MITYTLFLLWVTFLFITLAFLIGHEDDKHFSPIMVLIISFIWQIFGVIGFIDPPGSHNNTVIDPIFENLTYSEFYKIAISVVVGFFTTILILIDCQYYKVLLKCYNKTATTFINNYNKYVALPKRKTRRHKPRNELL